MIGIGQLSETLNAKGMTMEKYEKNRDIKPDTLFQTLVSVGRLILVLLGIIGIAIEFFKDDGWLKQTLNKMLDSDIGLWWFPIIFAILYLFNRWMTSVNVGKASKRGDLPLNAMMLVGAFFLYRIITTGGF